MERQAGGQQSKKLACFGPCLKEVLVCVNLLSRKVKVHDAIDFFCYRAYFANPQAQTTATFAGRGDKPMPHLSRKAVRFPSRRLELRERPPFPPIPPRQYAEDRHELCPGGMRCSRISFVRRVVWHSQTLANSSPAPERRDYHHRVPSHVTAFCSIFTHSGGQQRASKGSGHSYRELGISPSSKLDGA